MSSGKKADAPPHGCRSPHEKCEMFLERHPSLLNSRVPSVPSGSQEKIRQGDGEVLRGAGETPEPVGPEERVAPARGAFVAASSSWNRCRFSRSHRSPFMLLACAPSRCRQTTRWITCGSISTKFLWSTSSRCRRSRRGRCLTLWSR